MSAFILWIFWTILLLSVGITLAYRRVDLRTATIIMGFALLTYVLMGVSFGLWSLLLFALFAGMASLNFGEFRRNNITTPLLRRYRSLVPAISDTEREALEAGTVWWDGELFSGTPDWSKLTALPAPALSPDEQAFLDGPTEELCRLLDDWEVSHQLADMPQEVWEFIKKNRFFAMIIPREYGGLEFSPFAVATVLAKIAGRNAVAASTIGVPNSLGPGGAIAALRD